MEQKENIRIGLDIGIASVGWAVMSCDENGEPKRIAAIGSRVFDTAEQPKTGASLALDRRIARGARRRTGRKVERLRRTRQLFEQKGVKITFSGDDVNILRAKALDEKISENDFARVLYRLCKNRGFKSNRKSEENTKETGDLIKNAKKNDALLESEGYRTIGEMNASRAVECKSAQGTYLLFDTRNHGGTYEHTVYRKTLLKEIRLLFESQRKFGNALADDDTEAQFIEIFESQRNFDEGPGKGSKYSAEYKVGKCQFEMDEDRAPKASWAFEWSQALQNLNNLGIVEIGAGKRALTNEERALLLDKMRSDVSVTYWQARRLLRLNDTARFNLSYPKIDRKTLEIEDEAEKQAAIFKEVEKFEKKRSISKPEKSRAIRNALSEDNRDDNNLVDEIAVVLSHAKSDSKRMDLFNDAKEHLMLVEKLSEQEKENLLCVNCEKFGMLSLKALRKIIPYLEEGQKYSDACESAGYIHTGGAYGERSRTLNTRQVHEAVNEITSPVVKRSISQTIKVINAIINRYGSPIAVNIELARDMSRSREERDKIKRENDKRYEENQKTRERFSAKFGREPKGADLLKLRLYEEQCGQCVYSGEPIVLERIFEDNYYQIDHVMPFSRSFNDSYSNKVLVKTGENQNKGNRLPYEYMDEERYAEYVKRVECLYKFNPQKRQILLKQKLDEDEWKSRALNDTRYICRFVKNLIEDHLEFAKSDLKKKVYTYNGMMTAYVRWNWGISKIREDGDMHHAVDAAVIACMTESMRLKIEKYNRYKEIRYSMPLIINDEAFDPITGEQIVDFDRLPLPYPTFRNELKVRSEEEDVEVMRQKLKNLGYTDEQTTAANVLFVSRMPKRKAKGQIHDATVYSAKYYDESGKVIEKVPLTELKLSNDKREIVGYFNKNDDVPLYELLLKRLQDADGDANKAFAEPVYKPTRDGKQGPIVKKVKREKPITLGVRLDKVKGLAGNGGMVRIDVFAKGGKYYCVPVYIADVYAGILPNRAATANKGYKDWDVMDNSYEFLFSLYQNDLVYIEHKSGIPINKKKENANSNLPKQKLVKAGYFYYNSFGISVASASLEDITGCYVATSIGVKTLKTFNKCEVDVLGNVRMIAKECRQPLNNKRG